MPEPTLVQVFGVNATQTSTTLTISKSDLATVGLTASANNTAESLLVALVKLWNGYLTEANQETNVDIQVTVEPSQFPSIVFRNEQNYRQNTYNINIQKIDSGTTIDPDDY
ncbi:hypothetical protein [Calothrix sp. 336/3]|uniref:hypothetical protein n=1 Tax=Calothrix sp. 336/3 TaxID=1337936 RepID=UPI0004E3874D|nr:hypothetical protein [Calothrix sp. 336/3]AKG24548.1 hypothetical protein IJ00_09515 [Calothrix sp. 336/3]